MSTYTQIYYHIVFSTKERAPVLIPSCRTSLFRCAWGIIRRRDSRLYRINGTLDHLHILTNLHPSVSLANLVKEIKGGLSHWIKSNQLCPGFSNRQNGYGAFTHSGLDKERLIEYIRNQEDHHRSTPPGSVGEFVPLFP